MPLAHQVLEPFTASLVWLIVGAAVALAALPAKLGRRVAELLPIRIDSNPRRR